MRRRLRLLAFLLTALTVGLTGLGERPAVAHAGLVASEPAAGAVFDDPPTTVRLKFIERPEASLAVIRVSGAEGTSYATAPPAPVPGDDLTLAVPVRLPEQRTYTVTWRVVSSVDGHVASGTFTFGVGVVPAEVTAPASPTTRSELSPLELLGRWTFALGIIAVIGATSARLVGFGAPVPGRPWASVVLAPAGLGAAAMGLVLLGMAQRSAAGVSWPDLLGTSVGRALGWRAVGLGVAAAALGVGLSRRSRRSGLERVAAWVTVMAASAAIAAHVTAGHAGAPGSLRLPTIAAQWGHVIAVAVWAGGLAALLIGLRGAPSDDKAGSVRRFSAVAGPVLAVIVVTGVLRAFREVGAWSELASTSYGRVLVVKLAAVAGIVGLAAVNRRRGVPTAGVSLQLVRRLSGYELGLAVSALGAAALLASLPPPTASPRVEPIGLTATGVDFGKSVRVRLTTATAVTGPNRFDVRVSDYDSGEPVAAERVSLRFRPLDDPTVEPTVLVLEPTAASYQAKGTNLSLDGRWEITALVDSGAASVSVPLELQTRSAPQFLSVQRIPGEPVKYTLELVSGGGLLRVWADPQRSGPSQLYATYFDRFGEELPVGDPVLTVGAGPSTRQHGLRRLGPNRFVADIDLAAGRVDVALVTRTVDDDQRLRGEVTLEVPRR
jgi:copper transport protein